MLILYLTIFVGMSEFGEDLEELSLFYFSMCYISKAEGIAFIFIIEYVGDKFYCNYADRSHCCNYAGDTFCSAQLFLL